MPIFAEINLMKQMTPETLQYKDVWHNCLTMIQKRTSSEEFDKWIVPIIPLGFEEGILRLGVPDKEFALHLDQNYIPLMRPIICSGFGENIRLRYSVPAAQSASTTKTSDGDTSGMKSYINQTNTQNIKNPFVIPGIRKITIDPQLNFDYTFENFIEGECNRLARSVSEQISMAPGKTFNPLFVWGDPGLGKTHLVQAVGIEVKKRFPDMNVLYVSAQKFQAQYQNATLRKEINDFIHFYQMIDVLIIDDIQEFSGKPGTQNIFFNIFNHLHLSHKQLIFTCDRAPVELKDIEERLISRFKWGIPVKLDAPDFATKEKIIYAKAARLGAHLPEDVVKFLAENIIANVREIEGAISSFVANSTILNLSPTIELAREILKAYVVTATREVTIDIIVDSVCRHFDMTRDTFYSPKRVRQIVIARQIAMYLAKSYTALPLKAIGEKIGGKNHATVVHACKAINNLLETNKQVRADVDHIERTLK